MNFSKYLLSSALLFGANTASAELLKTYAGTNYDINEAYRVARYQAPEMNCIFTNEPGTFPMPWDEQCYDSAVKKIAFINTATKQAFKFSVQRVSKGNGVSVVNIEQISFTTIERRALNDFYEINDNIKAAASRISLSSIGTYNARSFASYSSSSGSECSSHPTSYFTPRGQRNTHEDLAKGIRDQVGNRSWGEFIRHTDYTGGGIQLGKGNLGLNVTLSHSNNDIFTHVNYGDPASNLLVFKVHYHGDMRYGGERRLNLSFDLQRGASAIDGIEISRLFTNDSDVVVDLTKTPVSNCLLDFIKDTGTPVSGNGTPGGSGRPGGSSGPGGGGPGGGYCTETIRAYTCSTTGDGKTTCSKQVFAVPVSC